MKICARCKISKKIEDFPFKVKSKDWRQPYCSDCNKQYKAEWYILNNIHVKDEVRKRKEFNLQFILRYLLEHPCTDCGEDDPAVLEFDHLYDKTKGVCEMARNGFSLKVIQKEIDKCEVVCANCHKRRTYSRNNSYRLRGVGQAV